LLQLTFPVAQTNSAQNIIIMTFNMTKAFWARFFFQILCNDSNRRRKRGEKVKALLAN
jgi:hypothetical protein